VKLRAAEMAALQFWAAHIPRWNRLCPIVAGFSPVCRHDCLARTDASTEWGGGRLVSTGTGGHQCQGIPGSVVPARSRPGVCEAPRIYGVPRGVSGS
jgi:hypothetical protein